VAFSKTDVRNSVAEGNTLGFLSWTGGDLNLVHSVAVNNSVGVEADGGIVRLTDVLISHNGLALSAFGGSTVYTYGDNEVDGNGNNSFVATSGSKH
jgi:hypothetical protein